MRRTSATGGFVLDLTCFDSPASRNLPRALPCSKLYHDELVGRAKEEAYRAEKKVRAGQCTAAPDHTCILHRDPAPRGAPRLPLINPPGPARESLQARRAREDFQYMLKHMRDIKADTTWEAATQLCRGEPEWEGVPSDDERRRLFEEHLEKLKVGGVEICAFGCERSAYSLRASGEHVERLAARGWGAMLPQWLSDRLPARSRRPANRCPRCTVFCALSTSTSAAPLSAGQGGGAGRAQALARRRRRRQQRRR